MSFDLCNNYWQKKILVSKGCLVGFFFVEITINSMSVAIRNASNEDGGGTDFLGFGKSHICSASLI